MNVVVIGGNPAGMSAASRIKRKDPDSRVVVLEKTHEVSYGACGLPYYVAGLNNDLDLIRIRKVPEFEANGVQVKLGREAVRASFEEKKVWAKLPDGEEECYCYDKLVIASGSSPKAPPIPGIKQKNIFQLKTLQDAERIKQAIAETRGNVVIVGGGYIGLEIAEACVIQKARSVRVVEALPRVLNVFDPEFSMAVQNELEKHGVMVHTGEMVKSFSGEDGKVTGVVTDKGSYGADIVILSIGVSPNTGWLEGIDKLPNGAIITDTAMRTSVEDVFAAGDCATVMHGLLKKPVYFALGTNANKQGRLAGDSVLGKPVHLERALGTSMLRCMDLELAKTGLGEENAKREKLDYMVKTVKCRSHARYYPNPYELTVKLTVRPEDHVLIGAQIMGEKEAVWRINVFACAIDRGMKAEEPGYLDMGYAPPFAGVWDAVQIAANAVK